jgi:hypothetical protein
MLFKALILIDDFSAGRVECSPTLTGIGSKKFNPRPSAGHCTWAALPAASG